MGRLLAAAQRLDAVRRAASAAASEQAATVQAAEQELAAVRARLAPQRPGWCRISACRTATLAPQPGRAGHGGAGRRPAARTGVLAALRQARSTADAADAAMLGRGPGGAPWRPWARNLLVYGPFAAAVLIVQIVLYLVAPSGSLPHVRAALRAAACRCWRSGWAG